MVYFAVVILKRPLATVKDLKKNYMGKNIFFLNIFIYKINYSITIKINKMS